MKNTAGNALGMVLGLIWASSVVPVVTPAARADVTSLQNGIAPSPDYAGCADTKITNEQYAPKDHSGLAALAIRGANARLLIRFDLSSVPKDHEVGKAVLRLYATDVCDAADKLPCLRVTRPWEDKANWKNAKVSATPVPATKKPAEPKPGAGEPSAAKPADEDWTTPGGDVDTDTDYGKGEKGVIAIGEASAGLYGQAFEFDVTPVVAKFVSGEWPNYGLCIRGGKGASLASSEWPIPAYRPVLIVEHYAKGGKPGKSAVEPLPATPKNLELNPVAKTADAGREPAGNVAPERWGAGKGCRHAEFADAYINEGVSLSGLWGWMPAVKAGGGAGEFSRALIRADLRGIPAKATIQSAKLRLCMVNARNAAGHRFGAYLLATEWKPEEASATEAMAGKPWSNGGAVASADAQPAALAEGKGAGKDNAPVWIEWDLTGAVRAWVQGTKPNNGILIDNRVDNGAFIAFSSRDPDPEHRPYLEVVLAPGTGADEIKVNPAAQLEPPTGDYWVEAMKQAHARFKGKPGTLAQYGDSITITMAFLAPHGWGRTIVPEKCPPEFAQQLKELEGYAKYKLWREWKGGGWGNDGSTTVTWFRNHVDRWQQVMEPEVAVILFGTNDTNMGPHPPMYTEIMSACIERLLADGTVPILTTLPPRSSQKKDPATLERVLAIRQAQILIARTKKIPLIDFYQEIMSRQPENWDTTLMGDGTHPSMRKPWDMDFTEEGLKNSGYTLRNYLTLKTYYEVYKKVIQPAGGAKPADKP